MIKQIETELDRIIKADIPFIRNKMSVAEAREFYKKTKQDDKLAILDYRPENTVHMYECDGYQNYMYGRMVPSTGFLTKWVLRPYAPGIIVQYPRSETKGEIPPFEDAPTFSQTLKEARTWGNLADAGSIPGINKMIKQNGTIDFISMCEARHNKMLGEIGDLIEKNRGDIRLICIAGPSSSGKTTFSNRLRVELLSRGIKPIRLSIDDYYLPRKLAPLDENGKPDLEDIHALDITLFNQNIADLIAGVEVEIPKFDFHIGQRVKGRKLIVPTDQPIIIEGIHALNDTLTSLIPTRQKFRIYIAPQAQLNFDNQNPLSLTDLRLLRRIVRDYKYRNASALETMRMWPSVRKGEFKWIYQTQESADYVFNSFLNYELPIMRKYAIPVLSEISNESKYFAQAERLIRMLKYFINMDDTWVPCNSLIREFIGGSCYADDAE
jgi:uridine kinase